MGTAMHAGPWGYGTGGGVITGAVASPTLVGRRLSHGNEGSREVSGSTVLSRLQVIGYRIVGGGCFGKVLFLGLSLYL